MVPSQGGQERAPFRFHTVTWRHYWLTHDNKENMAYGKNFLVTFLSTYTNFGYYWRIPRRM